MIETNCQQNCEFNSPINLGSGKQPDYEYSKMTCNLSCQGNDETIELIQNPVYPDRAFFVNKTLTYGDALVLWFITIFLITMIVGIVFNFFWKK